MWLFLAKEASPLPAHHSLHSHGPALSGVPSFCSSRVVTGGTGLYQAAESCKCHVLTVKIIRMKGNLHQQQLKGQLSFQLCKVQTDLHHQLGAGAGPRSGHQTPTKCTQTQSQQRWTLRGHQEPWLSSSPSSVILQTIISTRSFPRRPQGKRWTRKHPKLFAKRPSEQTKPSDVDRYCFKGDAAHKSCFIRRATGFLGPPRGRSHPKPTLTQTGQGRGSARPQPMVSDAQQHKGNSLPCDLTAGPSSALN